MKFHLSLILAAAFLSTACDKPEPPDIIAPQREAMEKAKGVEQTLQKSADETRAKIDEAERGQ